MSKYFGWIYHSGLEIIFPENYYLPESQIAHERIHQCPLSLVWSIFYFLIKLSLCPIVLKPQNNIHMFVCACVCVRERERERDLTCWTLANICQLWESFHIISLVTFSTRLPFFFNSKLDGGLAVPVLLISSSVVCNTFETPRTVAHQAPLSMGFSKHKYWSGLPFPSLGDLPGPGIEPMSPALTSMFFTTESPGNPIYL